MINNYLKMAWRVLSRQKLFSLINILGLVIGMVACMLIVQYISFELSYDEFQANADRIYRVKHQNYSQGNLIENLPKTYSAVGPALKAELPGVEEQTRISKLEGQVSTQLGTNVVAFNERRLYLVEPSFLKVFSFPLVQGTVNALSNPNTVVVTESTAKKYFGNADAIGKTIRIQQQISGTNITATITGVCKDVPANSHLQFDFLVSQDPHAGDWLYADSYTYLLLSPKTNYKRFEAMLPAFIKNHVAGKDKLNNTSFTLGKTNISNIALSLQPLRDIHLYSNLTDEISAGGNGNMVWYMGIIAALILVIAYINYINLATAKVIERAREVGIRKVLGSQRVQLIIQFLFESALLNVISLIVAVFAVILLMPWFSALCGVQIQFTLCKNPAFLPGFAGCLLAGIVLSAFYPALVLSDYKPVQILKGKFQTSAQSISLRKSLVVFQFVATIAFMIGTLVVYRQVNYMKSANKGMDMIQTLVIRAPQIVRDNDAEAMSFMHKDSVFQTEIMRNPRVQNVTSSSAIPGEVINYIMAYSRPEVAAGEKRIRLPTLEIGGGFLNQFKVKVIAGSNFDSAVQTNGSLMMLNEAAVLSLGYKSPQDAVGKIIQTKNGRGRVFDNTIVGVIKNFHQTSLKEGFTPTVFRLIDPSSVTHYELKVNTTDMPATIAQINKTYKAVFTDAAFDYFFLDEFFDQQYKTEQHFGQVFSLFSGLAILVACLGLFGLTLITIGQRVKEIGIRKLLGASIPNILLLISKDFVKLLAIANAIAIPLAYWGCYKWLQNYKFRIDFSIWFFIVPMVSVFVIALATISLQAVKAAIANPVKSLRAE
ncbi:ABC transporter permease [Mucilaginibacter sp. 14171R-50]|uniref:ABC transporter permease n=1 Tax=Mucilaginibacter sp. 14171R-50 TaxID=2703789 RepID=UPI00138BCF83|nr:ABC transporter permease [Mucilaginibacter sp. 14171R-50]QHS55647.1 ABC transporter permease [Mucilaginibacter sp. 14171R-50]